MAAGVVIYATSNKRRSLPDTPHLWIAKFLRTFFKYLVISLLQLCFITIELYYYLLYNIYIVYLITIIKKRCLCRLHLLMQGKGNAVSVLR